MGWGRTLFLGDIGNRLDIEDTEHDIAVLRRRLTDSLRKDMSQDKRIQMLEAENAELKLYLAAVVRLLMSKGVVTDEELEVVVRAVDAEDGNVDGRFDGNIA